MFKIHFENNSHALTQCWMCIFNIRVERQDGFYDTSTTNKLLCLCDLTLSKLWPRLPFRWVLFNSSFPGQRQFLWFSKCVFKLSSQKDRNFSSIFLLFIFFLTNFPGIEQVWGCRVIIPRWKRRSHARLE